MAQKYPTIIVGGGQAGLSTSYHLSQRGQEHVILEQAAQAGNAWRNDRWDSFTLLTPNWSFRLPGAEYRGEAPDGFMKREEIVAAFEQYILRFHLPVQYGVKVSAVEPITGGSGYRVSTDVAALDARNVVIATGLFQRPKIPAFSADLPAHITQLHSGRYRNPQALPPGAVLVVGSGQSGCQIAEELYLSGRQVYLCVGSAGRVPRRYRGKDVYEWLNLSGFLDRTVDKLPSPKARFAANPHLSGRDGGRSLNLHQFARDGVVLLGRIQSGGEGRIWLAPDLKENLARSDKFEAEIVKMIDGLLLQTGMDAPLESLPVMRDGYEAEEIGDLDLLSVGITTIIWAMGYRFDFDMVRLPIFDGDGYPVQKRGVTDYAGLFFMGLPWLYKQKSGLLLGVGEDAEYIAEKIAGRERKD
jgi:putative flavoprotein involved in K+ transport